MARTVKKSFIVVADNHAQQDWLKQVLEEEGDVVTVDQKSVERVRQLLDLTGSQTVFVGLSVMNMRENAAFIEDLTALKNMLLVIAVADHADNELLLSAMRAGAREFITTDTRPPEVMRLVNRLQSRAPVMQNNPKRRGNVLSLISARPGTDTPMLALHLALALQADPKIDKVLLLDLGTPAADTLTYLGINATYSFMDAVRSLRRLDETLIESAFAKHSSGLKMLALPEEQSDLSDITSADIYVLLGVLQQFFSKIVINLGGVPHSEFLSLLISNSDRTLAVLEQSVPSCKQNMQLIHKISQGQIDMTTVQLVVDRYLSDLPPDAENLAKGLDIELLTTLPPSGMARLKMMNSGESLFECAPRDAYTQAIKKVAKKLTANDPDFNADNKQQATGLMSRIKRWFKRDAKVPT